VLEHSSSWNLDKRSFTYTWYNEVQSLVQQWAVPVPRRVRLQKSYDLAPTVVRLRGPGFERRVPIPDFSPKDFFIIPEDDLLDEARQFLSKFSSDRSFWTPFRTAEGRKRWWIVPRWSLPVWKVSGYPITNGSGLAALFVVEEIRRKMLRQEPEKLLSPDMVEELVNHVRLAFPKTVEEVWAARGERLPRIWPRSCDADGRLLAFLSCWTLWRTTLRRRRKGWRH
jgi:hypothetical protein